MQTKLPSRLYRARTIRVVHLNRLEVDLSLGFGNHVRKNIVLEGVDAGMVPAHRRREAQHCLVIIAGGRDIIVQAEDDEAIDGFVRGRVFIDVPLVGEVPPGCVCTPYGLDESRVEVSMLYMLVGRLGFEPEQARAAMRAVART